MVEKGRKNKNKKKKKKKNRGKKDNVWSDL
jgi:hypothetical protein